MGIIGDEALRNEESDSDKREEYKKKQRKMMAALVKKAQGDLTGKEFSERAGISKEALSRIKHGDYSPSWKVIQKIVDCSETRVSIEDFMDVIGLRSSADQTIAKIESEQEHDENNKVLFELQDLSSITDDKDRQMLERVMEHHKRIYSRTRESADQNAILFKKYEKDVTGAIYYACAQKKFLFQKTLLMGEVDSCGIIDYNLGIELVQAPILSWVFGYKYYTK